MQVGCHISVVLKDVFFRLSVYKCLYEFLLFYETLQPKYGITCLAGFFSQNSAWIHEAS